MRRLILNKIASDIGDIVCVGIHALDIGVLTASCTARSSTITIGYGRWPPSRWSGLASSRNPVGRPERERLRPARSDDSVVISSSSREAARCFSRCRSRKNTSANRAYEVLHHGYPISAARMETKTLEPVDIPEVAIETLQAKYHRGAASERPGLRALEEDNLEAGRKLAE